MQFAEYDMPLKKGLILFIPRKMNVLGAHVCIYFRMMILVKESESHIVILRFLRRLSSCSGRSVSHSLFNNGSDSREGRRISQESLNDPLSNFDFFRYFPIPRI